jgi:hypothetical protein
MSDEGSGPVDGQEIKLDLVPHHQKHALKKEGGFLKTLLTGGVIIGGIVGVYMLWKHFFGKKKVETHHPPGQGGEKGKGGGHRKRELDTKVVEDELAAVYAEAIADEEFMDFLERFVDGEEFDGVV